MSEENEDYNQTQIKTFLENLKSESVSVDNYARLYENLKNMDKIVLSQIESCKYEHNKLKKQLKESSESSGFKEKFARKIVSVADFELVFELSEKKSDIVTWTILQQEMKDIMLKKFVDILGDVNAMQIKKESLREFREMNKEQRGLFIELFNNKYEQLNDKINYLQTKQLDFFKDMVNKILDKQQNYEKELGILKRRYEDDPANQVVHPIRKISDDEVADDSVKDILDRDDKFDMKDDEDGI
jgi:hypothetical protein